MSGMDTFTDTLRCIADQLDAADDLERVQLLSGLREKTRQECADVMARAAVAGTSMRSLARASGVSVGTVSTDLARAAGMSQYVHDGRVDADGLGAARHQMRFTPRKDTP